LLFVFTGGVVEAADERDKYFGEERSLDCLRGASNDPAAEVLKKVTEEIRKFVGHTRQHDDITCLVFRLEHAMAGPAPDVTSHAAAIPS
jgi:sigma-B regulation protein RsbU (phosphoserine phosphatase)